MPGRKGLAIIIIFLALVLLFVSNMQPANASPSAQLPTISIPTVTGTPTGPMATVRADQNEDFVNVRSGPNVLYPKIGVLLVGQSVPAVGRSPGSEWVQIEYPGVPGGKAWVFAAYVSIVGGELPIVEPPPSPTPQYTATIDPTLAAQFVVTEQPTRLPTFTEPAPLTIPTFEPVSVNPIPGGIPAGLIITILGIIGILLGIFSILTSR